MDLLGGVKDLLKERCDSLLKDVRHCVAYPNSTPDWPAPFPALLYCFSTIDLLGSLYTGQFDAGEDTKNAKKYMKDFMNYGELQIELIQQIYRHKLVHTGMPKSVYSKKGIDYYWEYIRSDRNKHLKISHKETAAPQARWFTIGILNLAEDIHNSVFGPGGFLERLSKDKNLQKKCLVTFQKL